MLTVYRNIFESDMSVSDGVDASNTISQHNNTDRFVIYDQVSLTRHIVFGSDDDISKLFRSRTVPIKSTWGMTDFIKAQHALTNDEAVTLTTLIYHKHFEGAHCQCQIVQGYRKPINRYHVSKQ